ncbi:MAG: gamma-glutamyltransferase [Lewinellaceae bacterium]|nr:gamma-glutamyltransferase [Lewinellaceae bacterium]
MSNRFQRNLFYLLLLFLCQTNGSAQAQESEWYTPFPYTLQKEAVADSGMVVCAHPLATKVGLAILRKGGNAVDAAIAVQFTLAVVYPQAGNIGGGGFMVYRSKSGVTDALDFREKAPAAATETMYQDSLGRVLPQKSRFGALACGVPGTVDGMLEAHKKYGKLPWGQLVMPAVELAEKGFQITAQEAENLQKEQVNFFKHSSIVPAFVNMKGWQEGDWLIQKDLGKTLRRIASEGRTGFYDRATAALILHEMELKKGLITYQDLQDYHSVWRKPVEFDWNGLHIISMSPPSSGGLMLQQMLGMFSIHAPSDTAFHTTEAVHLMAEVERRAFADRAKHMGDPDFWKVPSDSLVNPNYLKMRMAEFMANKATPSKSVQAGTFKESEETTHFSVVDQEGNAVSITTTLNDSYGSRVVVSGAGFILNNEMDDFSAKPGTPNLYGAIGGKANAVAGGKRPLSSMTPTIVAKNGKLSMVLGTPGGTTIPTSVFQVIVNVYWFKMSLPDAVQKGRFHHQWLPDRISVEEGALPESVEEALRAMGHAVEPRDAIGRVEAILVTPEGKLQGVADRRGDDCAGGY